MELQDSWNRRHFVRVTASAAAGAAAFPTLPRDSRAEAAAPTATQSDELARLTIAQASRMIREREISCTELTQVCLARAEAVPDR